jgi:NADH:ubiquinone oxidoreductase subunit 6 (subunit J)
VNWHTFFFLLFALVACGFAVMVVLSSNIVRMALYLIFSLGATAGLFFLAGADFVGAMQLMIYVGGTLVLLVFGVMLTAQGPFVSMKTRGGDWILAALLSGSLLAFLGPAAFSVREWTNLPPAAAEEHHAARGGKGAQAKVRFASTSTAADEPAAESAEAAADESSMAALPGMATQPATATRLGMGLLGVRVDKLEGRSPELQRGMSGYLLPFEIVSVHLLVVLVGAAYLARTKRRATRQ